MAALSGLWNWRSASRPARQLLFKTTLLNRLQPKEPSGASILTSMSEMNFWNHPDYREVLASALKNGHQVNFVTGGGGSRGGMSALVHGRPKRAIHSITSGISPARSRSARRRIRPLLAEAARSRSEDAEENHIAGGTIGCRTAPDNFGREIPGIRFSATRWTSCDALDLRDEPQEPGAVRCRMGRPRIRLDCLDRRQAGLACRRYRLCQAVPRRTTRSDPSCRSSRNASAPPAFRAILPGS